MHNKVFTTIMQSNKHSNKNEKMVYVIKTAINNRTALKLS